MSRQRKAYPGMRGGRVSLQMGCGESGCSLGPAMSFDRRETDRNLFATMSNDRQARGGVVVVIAVVVHYKVLNSIL